MSVHHRLAPQACFIAARKFTDCCPYPANGSSTGVNRCNGLSNVNRRSRHSVAMESPVVTGVDKSQASAIVASIIFSEMKCVQKAVVDRGQDDGHQRQEDEAAEETVERREELS